MNAVFDFKTVLFLVLTVCGLGLAVVSVPQHPIYWLAQLLFGSAALIFLAKILWWMMYGTNALWWRYACGATLGAITLVALAASLTYLGSLKQVLPVIPVRKGGQGGGAQSTKGGLALGGRGGDAGIGTGGDGGNAVAHDPSSVAVGGDGGSGPTADGKGGKGGRSAAEHYYEFVGKPMPRELRGWGVGGDGGDAGHPVGHKGGAGLVKFTYTVKPVEFPPKSMFDLYQRESYANGNVSIEQLDAVTPGKSPTKIEVSLGWGMNCEEKQLFLYVPETSETMSILTGFVDVLPKRIEKLDIQARAGITDPCVPSSVTDGYIPFSNTVTVYHESEVADPDQKILIHMFTRYGLRLALRGPDYFTMKKKNWTKADRQNTARYLTRNVFHPGDL